MWSYGFCFILFLILSFTYIQSLLPTFYVIRNNLGLLILLSLHPEHWDYWHVPPCPVCVMLDSKPKASWMLGKHSTNWTTCPNAIIWVYIPFFTSKIVCSTVLSACIHVHYMHPWYLWRPEVGVQSPETTVSEGCELHVGVGSETYILCKGSRCSNSRSCLQPKRMVCFLAW